MMWAPAPSRRADGVGALPPPSTLPTLPSLSPLPTRVIIECYAHLRPCHQGQLVDMDEGCLVAAMGAALLGPHDPCGAVDQLELATLVRQCRAIDPSSLPGLSLGLVQQTLRQQGLGDHTGATWWPQPASWQPVPRPTEHTGPIGAANRWDYLLALGKPLLLIYWLPRVLRWTEPLDGLAPDQAAQVQPGCLHAVLCYGYDPYYYYCLNSYGPGWGHAGHGRLSRSYPWLFPVAWSLGPGMRTP
jgi:hypothetical protein